MKMIAAVDANWGIGYKGKLLVQIPEDMKYFRRMTIGNVVVMGRKTLESFPNKRPLPDRTNIILSRNPSYNVKNAIVVGGPEELLGTLQAYDPEKVFVVGGEMIYRELLDYCDEAYITKIDFAYDADAHFPNLDEDPEWMLEQEGDEETYFDVCYAFCKYIRRK